MLWVFSSAGQFSLMLFILNSSRLPWNTILLFLYYCLTRSLQRWDICGCFIYLKQDNHLWIYILLSKYLSFKGNVENLWHYVISPLALHQLLSKYLSFKQLIKKIKNPSSSDEPLEYALLHDNAHRLFDIWMWSGNRYPCTSVVRSKISHLLLGICCTRISLIDLLKQINEPLSHIRGKFVNS